MNKYIYFIMFSFTCLIATTKANANNDGLICSNYWNTQFASCPTNQENFIKQQTPIPIVHDSCNNGDAICIGGDANVQPTFHSYGIYDIDNNVTNKFRVTVYPKVVNSYGLETQVGRVSVQRINPTQNDVDFTYQLNEAQHYHKKVQDSLTFTQRNGILYSGASESAVNSSLNACKTTLNYFNNDNGCTGAFNTEIRLAVQENSDAIAIISALDKASGLISTVSAGTIETGTFNKLLKFVVVIKFQDSSLLVLDVDVQSGVANIQENPNSSHTSDGQTVTQFFKRINITEANSADELESLLNNPLQQGPSVTTICRPRGVLVDYKATLVRTIIIVDPQGNERVINIYQREATFMAVGDC